ncbi:MAG TPA: hypothetical protein VNO55_05015, partial [Polyangia bacterium]|nr:hypothetical protein [Polyangia bacterium]
MTAPVHSRISRYHALLTRHPIRFLIGALAVFAASATLASRLDLKTSLEELLPSDDPGVVTLAKTHKRIGDLSLLLVGIRSPDHAANLRYAEALTKQLRALPPRVLSLATFEIRDLRDFFQRNKWLYVSEDDLTSIRDRVRNEIQKRKNPLFVSLDEDEPIDKMKDRLEHHNGLDDKFPDGVFTSNNGEYVWIAALPPGGLFVEHAGEPLYKAAHDLIEKDPPSRYHPAMRAEVAGPIATTIANRKAIENDLLTVTISC